MLLRKILLSIPFLAFLTQAYAQSSLAIGEWRAHLPYHQFISVTQSETTVYCATPLSIAVIDKEENSLEFLSKVNGLSQAGMGIIKYSQDHQVLIATYSNSVFDLISDDKTQTFEDINTDGNFVNRAIKDIFLDGDFAYFSCGFGIVRFNLVKAEFDFTLDLGISVESIAVLNNQIYAATEEGIYTAPNSGINLQDFSNWDLLDYTDGFPGSYSTHAINTFQNQLYFDIDNALYRLANGAPELVRPAEDGLGIEYLSSEGAGLLIGLRCLDDCTGKIIYMDTAGMFSELGSSCASRPLYGIQDQYGKLWFTDSWRNLRTTDNIQSDCASTNYNSPYTGNSTELLVHESQLYVASGGVQANGNYLWRQDGTFILSKEGNWSVINAQTTPILANRSSRFDHYKIAIHPVSGALFIGSFLDGIIEKNGDNFKIYDSSNSSLTGAIGDEERDRVSGLAFDENNNLWIANHSATKPISVYKSDGTWQNFAVPSSTGIRHLIVDNSGLKWAAIDGTTQGLIIFNDGGTIDALGDDTYRIISTSNSELPDNNVSSLAVDLEGSVWIGTSNGVAVVNCGASATDATCPVSKIIFEENVIDDENEYLLKGEVVNTIAVDGANRKWFGTANGIFVISPDGKEQIAYFNEENSPLFDNNVIDIAINPTDGEVFIGTNKGIISYRSDAIQGGVINESTAYAFPNPVRPEYRGPIAIKGLAENANVKITDATGQLIYETEALGGQAIWDGTDYNGRRASTGVYLVFSTSKTIDAPDTVVTKILFVQ